MLSLATELIEKISQNVEDLDDLKAFRLSCHHVNRSVEEQLYSRSQLTIHVVRQTIHHVTPLIVEMSAGTTRISKFVQNLEISALSPEAKRINHGFNPRPIISRPNEVIPDLSSEEMEVIELLDRNYENALKSLTSLKTLRCIITHKDDHRRAPKALRALSELQFQDFDLRVGIWNDNPSLSLDILPPLVQMSIYTRVHYGGDPISTTFGPAVETLARSSRLHTLSFQSAPERSPDGQTGMVKPSLNEVLRKLPALPLEQLLISGFTIDANEKNLEIFRNVKRIHNSTWHDNAFDPVLPIALQNAGIFKHYLNIKYPETTLFMYMGAFCGLKSLTLQLFGDVESSEVILQFYEKVLPIQKRSLETLSLISVFESGWCLDSQIELLAQCHSLRNLSLSVKYKDLLVDGVEGTVDYTLFHNLLDYFSEHEAIRCIGLYPAEGNQLRGVWKRPPHFDYSRKVAEQMTKTMDTLLQEDMPSPSFYRKDFCLTVKEDITRNPAAGGWKSYFIKEDPETVGAMCYWQTRDEPAPEIQYSKRIYKEFYHKILCV